MVMSVRYMMQNPDLSVLRRQESQSPTPSQNPYPVAQGGFLIGTLLASIFIGLLGGQLANYFSSTGDSLNDLRWRKLLVAWIAAMGCAHVVITSVSAYHYYVLGIRRVDVWSYFYWCLSAQDMLVPFISYTAHLFFGHRCWLLTGRRRWIGRLIPILATVTFALGITFAVTSGIWAHNPFVTKDEFDERSVGKVANILPTIWLVLAACIDLFITGTLLYRLTTAQPAIDRTRKVLAKVVVLTLETVLLTHCIGLVMFVLWLCSRTRSDAFWVFVELIAPTYLLSIMVTINSRARLRRLAENNNVDFVLGAGEFIIAAKDNDNISTAALHTLTRDAPPQGEMLYLAEGGGKRRDSLIQPA